ncbi:MAG: glycosyltransferase family 39 protein [Saccharofermentanales bacterium]
MEQIAVNTTDNRANYFPQLIITAVFSILALPAGLLIDKELIRTPDAIWIITAVLAAALIITAAVLAFFRKLDTGKVILLITAAGMGLRLIYILGTNIGQRQHDVYSFGSNEGHAGYIEYIYTNLHLPDFDPRTVFQFYHPPLHHALAALWMKINTLAGISFQQAGENIQILTMFYSGVFLMYTRRIFVEFGLQKIRLVIAYAMIAFYPAFIIMSGSINNDMLSVMLMQGAIYHAIRWYKGSATRSIIAAAAFMGFGMMAKLSVGTASLGIAFLFLLKIIEEPERRRRIIGQIAVFGVVCFPLALWWGLRNLLLFDLPVTYVPTLGTGSHQYIGGYPLLGRLADFSAYQFRNVYVAWGDPYFEHNVFIGLLKTATFGEQTLSGPSGNVYAAAVVLFCINALLALAVAVVGPIVLFGRKYFKDTSLKSFANILFITFLLAYVQFCLSYAHTCTQNVRYATPLIWIGAFVLASVAGRGDLQAAADTGPDGPVAEGSGQDSSERPHGLTKSGAGSKVLLYAVLGAVVSLVFSSVLFFLLLLTA